MTFLNFIFGCNSPLSCQIVRIVPAKRQENVFVRDWTYHTCQCLGVDKVDLVHRDDSSQSIVEQDSPVTIVNLF